MRYTILFSMLAFGITVVFDTVVLDVKIPTTDCN